MGNAQNAHLDRHGSRASSTSDVSSLGSNRHSRALDNVSLLSVDAVLTSYERRAFGELEAQAEADYSPPNAGPRSRSQTHPNPQVPPDPHLLSPGHQDRGHVSTSSYSDYSDQLSEGSPRSPVNDEEAAKWHEWTSKSDDDGLSDDRDSIDDSDELDVSRVNQDNKETAGASSEKDIAGPKDMEDTETPVLHSDTKDSLPQSSSSTEDVHVNIHSSSDDLSAHQDPGAVEPLDNKAGDTLVNSDTNTDTNIRLSNSGSVDDLDKFSDTVEVQSDSDALKTDSNQAMEEAIEPKEGNTGGDEVRHPDLHTDDSEDEVFSGSATDTPVGTPLARSRPVSIDDLLDCLQETAVDELELSARKKSAELGDAESASKSPTPPPILTPPPVGHMAMFSHLEDSDMIVNAEDYPHLHEIARSEPRSEPVTDLDDDSDDEEFQQSLFKDMESNDPEKSATRDEMSRLLMEMQRFGMKVEDDADSEDGSLEKERKVSRESVSSGGEYDTATMKVKRDVYSDSSDSSDDESSDSEDEKKVRESKYDSSSEEDEIIQHITPELIEKVINADDTMVDLFADGNDEPTTPTQTQEESVTPTDVLKDEPDPAKSDHGLESSEQEQYVHGSAPEIPVATLLENITGPVEETEPSDSKTSAVVAEAGDIKLSGVGEKEELEGNEKDHLEPSEKDEVSANGEELLKVSKEEEEDNEKGSLEMSENDKEKEDIELSEKAMIASNKNESIDNFEKEQGDGTDKNDIESSEKDEVEPIEKSSQDYDMKEPVTATSAENSLSVETSNDIKERSDKDADSEDVSIKDGSQPEAEKDKEDKKESDAQVSDTKTEIIHEAIAVEIIQPELSHNLEGSVQSEKSLDDPDRKEIDELVDQVDNVPQEAISPLKQPIDSVSPQDTITKGEDTVVATPLIVIDEAEVEETSADNTANVISEVSQVDEMVSDLAKDSDKSFENKTLVDVVEGNIPDSDGASKADVDVIQDTVSADKADQIVESIPLSQVDGDSDDIVVQSLDKVDQDLDNDNDKDQAVDTEIPTVDDHQAVDTEIPTVDDQHPTEPTDPEPRTDDDSDIETIRVLNTQVSDCANSDSLSEFKEAATDDEIVKASEASAPLESSPNTAEVPVEAANDEETEAKQLEPSKEEEGSEEVVVADAPEEPPAPDKPAEIIDGKAVEEKEQEAEVVQETQIITAEVTFKQEQFVFETITEVKDENDEDVTPDIKDKVTSEGCPLPSEAVVEAKPTKLDVIIEEEQPEIRSPETDKAQNEDDDDDDGSEPPPLPTSPPPNAIPQENKEKPMVSPEKLPPPVPEHQGYSRQLLRVISKKYPFRPMPKEPEAQHYYRQMMRQIETEIHKMIHAPEDPVRSDQTRASYRERKTSVPPPARLTMQTPVPPPPRAQTASRPPQHPAMIPTKSEPRKELSRKELKRRESETRKSKKLKKKDKENESRMAQFAQFMKLGSLSKEHGKTDTKKEEKEEKQPPPPPQQDTSPVPPPTGGHMVQRSVIIHRDERGYGLTVSGDNPVFVQCVKENGAAARVGVQEGDRIFKVNGTLVTQSNHVEVVKLIKCTSPWRCCLRGSLSNGLVPMATGYLVPGNSFLYSEWEEEESEYIGDSVSCLTLSLREIRTRGRWNHPLEGEEVLERRETFTWFDYSQKLRGLNGSTGIRPRRRPLKVVPATLSEEEGEDSDFSEDSGEEGTRGCDGGSLPRRELRRITRTYSQPASCESTSVPCTRVKSASHLNSAEKRRSCPPLLVEPSEIDIYNSSDNDSVEMAEDSLPDPLPPAGPVGMPPLASRKTHSRNSSFPEVRLRPRPGASSTLPRHTTQQSQPHPFSRTYSAADDSRSQDGDLDPVKRHRVNSFSEMKNAMKDKLNNVRTRVRRISSHSRPNIPNSAPPDTKPPQKKKRPGSDIINEDGVPEVKDGQMHQRKRHPSGSSGSDVERSGTPEDTASLYTPQQDLPPQPRHRVNSFTDVKNAMKEKLKSVQSRAKRRGRHVAGASGGLDLKHKSLSFQNLFAPSPLVRVASSPDVSRIGLVSGPESRIKDGGYEDSETDDQRRKSLTLSQRTASTDSSDIVNGCDSDAIAKRVGDATWRRSMDESQLSVMKETGDNENSETKSIPSNHGNSVSHGNSEVTDSSRYMEHRGSNVGYHGDNDTDEDEDTSDHHHGNDTGAGPYVALTLLGRASGGRPGGSDADQPGGPGSPPVPGDAGSNRITGPQPVNDAMNLDLQNQKVALTRMMYEKATSQLENMKAERNLSEAELNDQLRTIRRLESALFDLTGIPAESHLPGGPRQRKSDSGPDVMYGDDIPRRDVTVTRTLSDSRKRISHHEGIDHTQDRNKTTSLPSSVTDPSDPPPHSPSPGKDDGPLSDSADDYGDSAHYDEGGPAIIPMMQQMSSEGGPYSPNQVSNIMGAEDDFSTDEDGAMEEHGPFSDLNALKRKPSHLAVFLNYLISNSDPSPLLFYLVTEDYAKGTTKEMKKWLYEIHSTFLVNKAPLRVNVDESIVSNIDNTLLTKSDKVDAIQSAFGLARHHAQNEISELLADFRNKCALGLGSLYGTHEISIKDTMERSKELHLVEKYLVPHFERLMDRPEDAPDRNQAMAYALATVLKQVGCTLSGKAGTMLDRCPSFVAKDTKMFKLKTKKRQITVRDHTFVNVAYYSTTHCHQCSGIIWGIGLQGYQCAVCEMNVHKQCAEHVKESCSAGHKDRKKTKRTSSIMNIIRKPSSVTQPQITSKDPRWSDDGYTSPGSSSTFLRLHKDDDNDDESDRLNVTRPVSQMIEQLSPRSTDEPRSPSSPPRPRSPETGPDADAEQRITTPISKLPKKKHVVRSESLKGKQEAKSKTVRRSQSDLHVDDPHVKNVLNQSGSDTSIAGSLESPSNSSELLHDRGDSSWTKPLIEERYDDSDLEVENELPTLNTSIGADVVKKLKPKEKKRQDVMNELFHTERTHVRTLKVMNTVFYANMSEAFSMDLVQLLLPNIEELVQLHCSLNNSFKVRRKENTTVTHVGDLLLSRFSGEEGEKYKAACAHFCRSQSYALETLRVRQRKDQKLAMFLQESSMNPLCRRLELKDLIPTVMQRLTKYPLLIESLLKYTQVNTEEHDQLKEALVCTKDILSYVNEAVKEFEFQQKLAEIQKRLDKRSFENSSLPMVAEYKNLDLTQHKMVYNGPLTWRIGRNKQIELHVVLLEDIMVLLQRQDDKYVLKCSTTVVFGREDSKYTHSPILKLSNVLARNVAVDKRAFFLVCTSDIGPQIYELHAMSSEEKNKWLRYITEAVDSYKERTQKQPNKTPTATSPDQKAPRSRKESKEEPVEAEGLETYRSNSVDSLDKVTVLHPTSQTELIQPTEVVISDTVLEEAEPVLSAREKLKQTDESVRQRLEEKDRLIAEILNVPPSHYANIAEMASEIEGEKDIRDLVLGASYQTTRLTQLVNDSLTVPTEEESTTEEPVSPTSGTASAGKADDKPAVMVTIASNPILDITKKLNEQLSMLLNLFGEQEEQNKRLQRDLDVANEQLTLARDVPHHRSPSNSLSRHSRPNSFASITSSTSEVAETPEDMLTPTVASTEESGIYPVNSTPQDVSMTTVFEVMKLDVVEADADDANQNLQTVQSSESVSVAPTTISASIVTDANLNNPPPDEDSATTT